ncbi:MAG TPA: deoxyhypusine synthase family protein [Kiritimatiellia bacterium]|jgi:deoxyhypusine synthase
MQIKAAAKKFLKRKIVPVDPLKARTTNELLTALGNCSFQARNLAYALDVWEAMCRDRNCFRVLSLAGAMVPGGMALLIMRLIEKGYVHAIVCTGATMAHDICNTVAQGDQAHYIGNEAEDDLALRDAAVNRIYDTYLAESDFWKAEQGILKLLTRVKYDNVEEHVRVISTMSFCRQLGRILPGYSIITTAARKGVSIYVPAVSDSELGLNVLVGNKNQRLGKGKRVVFDALRDVDFFAGQLLHFKRAGLVSIGGGVPRNWSQQVYPYLNMKVKDRRVSADGYHYGVRITTDRPEFGGMSGCTISESKSWGKYETRAVEASVICDATIALPILASALFQRLEKA